MAKRKSFLLRTSPELLDALRQWAEQEMRSVNGQVEYVLRDALRRRGLLKGEASDSSAPGDLHSAGG